MEENTSDEFVNSPLKTIGTRESTRTNSWKQRLHFGRVASTPPCPRAMQADVGEETAVPAAPAPPDPARIPRWLQAPLRRLREGTEGAAAGEGVWLRLGDNSALYTEVGWNSRAHP